MEFEGSREEPGRWEALAAVPGEETTVLLALAPYMKYQFRVIAANEVGRSRPSRPSEHHETPPAGGSARGFPSCISVWPFPRRIARVVEAFRLELFPKTELEKFCKLTAHQVLRSHCLLQKDVDVGRRAEAGGEGCERACL